MSHLRRILLVLLAMQFSVVGSAKAWGPTARPTMVVSWHILATPDADASAVGAMPFETTIQLGTKLIDAQFTGAGCMVGSFPSPDVTFHLASGGDFRFKAESKSSESGTVTWQGLLKDGEIEGHITITRPGEAVNLADVERDERIQIDVIRQRNTVQNANGVVVNQGLLDAMANDIRRGRNLIVGRGRTLRFTFETQKIQVSPDDTRPTKTPATRPAPTAPPARQSASPDVNAELARLRAANASLELQLRRALAKTNSTTDAAAARSREYQFHVTLKQLHESQQQAAELREEVRSLRHQLHAGQKIHGSTTQPGGGDSSGSHSNEGGE